MLGASIIPQRTLADSILALAIAIEEKEICMPSRAQRRGQDRGVRGCMATEQSGHHRAQRSTGGARARVEAAFVVLRDLDTYRWRISHAGENRWRTISTCAMIANPHGARLNVFTPVESRRRRLSALPFQIALS